MSVYLFLSSPKHPVNLRWQLCATQRIQGSTEQLEQIMNSLHQSLAAAAG